MVDDEPDVAEALRRILSREVLVVTARGRGVRRSTCWRGDAAFDVILCDIMMPDLSGPSSTQRCSPSGPSTRAVSSS